MRFRVFVGRPGGDSLAFDVADRRAAAAVREAVTESLTRAVRLAGADGACVSFTVAVHPEGACEHDWEASDAPA